MKDNSIWDDHSFRTFIKTVKLKGCPLPGNTGDLVFDPFCGSGTTGVVCKKQNRKFVGIDNNIEYLNIAKKRLASTSNRNK
jgi:tRNA/tmRNA/rRNA uracil-C5-methylase (TrmA/RlmC/RlmD family)